MKELIELRSKDNKSQSEVERLQIELANTLQNLATTREKDSKRPLAYERVERVSLESEVEQL